MTEKTLIAIPFVDSTTMTIACIDSVLKTTSRDDDILLVDNASKPGNTAKMQGLYGDSHEPRVVDILHTHDRLSISQVWNEIIDYMMDNDYQYLCLLHNDTRVQTPTWLMEMRLAFNNYSSTCMMVFCRSGIGNCSHVQECKLESNRHYFFTKNNPLKGFCFLLARETIDMYGKFDERFHVTPEKVYQLNIFNGADDTGHGVVMAGDVVIDHYGNKTFENICSTEEYIRLYQQDMKMVNDLFLHDN